MEKQTYDVLLARDPATYLYSLFLQHGLHVTLSEMGGNKQTTSTSQKYEIQLPATELKTADRVLLEDLQVKGVEGNHYLNASTNKELEEIVDEPSGWGKLELMTAKVLLDERNSYKRAAAKRSFADRFFSTVKKPAFVPIPKFG